MSGSEPRPGPVDEFESIARLLRPLAEGAPEALGLMDDAAVIPARPGFDLVIAKDALVEGVHFLSDDQLDLVARKLLRVNLSDLAAKGAEPYAYLLAAAWPSRCGWKEREAFAAGLRRDQEAFGLKLIGGDTSSTPGPLALSLTILGWTPAGRMVKRSGAREGDRILVSGTIGDGFLGLRAARGELPDLGEGDVAWLADRYRLPQPRIPLIEILRERASAAADVSDGLIADAGHIGEASGVAMVLELDRAPVSAPARAWLDRQEDQARALAQLCSGGDDYEIVLTAPVDRVGALIPEALRVGLTLTDVGMVASGEGTHVRFEGRELKIGHAGWRHG